MESMFENGLDSIDVPQVIDMQDIFKQDVDTVLLMIAAGKPHLLDLTLMYRRGMDRLISLAERSMKKAKK